jgi:hypothetical protein
MVRGPAHVTSALAMGTATPVTSIGSPEVPNFRSKLTFTVAGGRATALDLGAPTGANV